MKKAFFKKKVLKVRKKIEFLYKERRRIESIKEYEISLFNNGFQKIAGIDEVGRGCLAGPVVAAAVVLNNQERFFLSHIKDSKKLTQKRREELYQLILEKIPDIGIGMVDSTIIDQLNIAQATFLAMKRAISNLRYLPDYILVDGFKIPHISISQSPLIKGESKSISIAIASVVAKVYRDRLMREYHRKFSCYGFDKNVGYGIRKHLESIKKYGPCDLHRFTFCGVKEKNNNANHSLFLQKRLFN